METQGKRKCAGVYKHNFCNPTLKSEEQVPENKLYWSHPRLQNFKFSINNGDLIL
jgi:hypothetical protein